MTKKLNILKTLKNKPFFSILIILIILLLGFLTYNLIETSIKLKTLESTVNKINEINSQKIEDIETIILATQEENLTLAETLEAAKEKSDSLERKFDKVNDNVDNLEKITTTDKELLQKYSKVFFLNEHYSPSDLETIPSKYTYEESRKYEIHEEVWPQLEDLLEEAEEDGMDLQIISAFRSFGEQAILKGAYAVTYGAGTANQFSADQGYSEHQLGTTVDFTNSTVGSTYSGFAQSPEYAWLLENAHRWGFILSYPNDNDYYQFEPWHWRYVGEKLAGDLYDDGEYFYEMPQREIDEYIIYLFD